ncbi:GGDEF domain-containing protein [Candidatus Saccharibacteria bacterium]|nr:GGDEF domain-containing protein [Candidatus Saccharibacteria bacterium]
MPDKTSDLEAYALKINELQARIRELEKILVTDELTQVLNRRGLEANLAMIAKEVNYQLKNPEKRRSTVIKALSVVFIDIDHFKVINDKYGHAGGDYILREIAQVLRRQVRQLDIIGRYGGEEIVLGLIGADRRDAERIAEQIRHHIENHEFVYEGQTIPVTASLGVVELEVGMSPHTMMELADQALYQAKNTGRNKVVVIDGS